MRASLVSISKRIDSERTEVAGLSERIDDARERSVELEALIVSELLGLRSSTRDPRAALRELHRRDAALAGAALCQLSVQCDLQLDLDPRLHVKSASPERGSNPSAVALGHVSGVDLALAAPREAESSLQEPTAGPRESAFDGSLVGTPCGTFEVMEGEGETAFVHAREHVRRRRVRNECACSFESAER